MSMYKVGHNKKAFMEDMIWIILHVNMLSVFIRDTKPTYLPLHNKERTESALLLS